MKDKVLPGIGEDRNGLLDGIRVFALDMDGTVYLGEKWIPGAQEFLARVEASGRRFCFLTNNSSKNADVYVDKLARMGLTVSRDRIVTSGQATIRYLQDHFPGKRVFLLGNELLQAEFTEAGVELSHDHPDVVVTAFDTSLDYAKMCAVCDHVRAGLPWIATHPDFNCPTETGFIPDAGAIHAFIHASTGRMPDLVIGKPNRGISDYLLERVGSDMGGEKLLPSQIAMVGDRLYTDIAAGNRAGFVSIFVLSGEASLEDAQRAVAEGNEEQIPDLVFPSVAEIPV